MLTARYFFFINKNYFQKKNLNLLEGKDGSYILTRQNKFKYKNIYFYFSGFINVINYSKSFNTFLDNFVKLLSHKNETVFLELYFYSPFWLRLLVKNRVK